MRGNQVAKIMLRHCFKWVEPTAYEIDNQKSSNINWVWNRPLRAEEMVRKFFLDFLSYTLVSQKYCHHIYHVFFKINIHPIKGPGAAQDRGFEEAKIREIGEASSRE